MIDLTQNYTHPDLKKLEDLLVTTDSYASKCLHVELNIAKYKLCVRKLNMIIPNIESLIDSVKNGDTSDIILNISTLAMNSVNLIKQCVPKSHVDFLVEQKLPVSNQKISISAQ